MIKGLHHVAISVKNLETSIKFYCDVLGLEILSRGELGGDKMERVTRLPGARGRGALLRAGLQHVELFEFHVPAPDGKAGQWTPYDLGITHFCIEVMDLDNECQRLEALGVDFDCKPIRFGSVKATYARDPDGNVVEHLQSPAP